MWLWRGRVEVCGAEVCLVLSSPVGFTSFFSEHRLKPKHRLLHFLLPVVLLDPPAAINKLSI